MGISGSLSHFGGFRCIRRSEEHTSELQSLAYLVCRLLLEKKKIFLSEGMLLALIGGGIGMLLALLIAWLQIKYHLIPLSGGSFLISYFPVKLRIMDFALVGATGFVRVFIASWIPSGRADSGEFSLRSE